MLHRTFRHKAMPRPSHTVQRYTEARRQSHNTVLNQCRTVLAPHKAVPMLNRAQLDGAGPYRALPQPCFTIHNLNMTLPLLGLTRLRFTDAVQSYTLLYRHGSEPDETLHYRCRTRHYLTLLYLSHTALKTTPPRQYMAIRCATIP